MFRQIFSFLVIFCMAGSLRNALAAEVDYNYDPYYFEDGNDENALDMDPNDMLAYPKVERIKRTLNNENEQAAISKLEGSCEWHTTELKRKNVEINSCNNEVENVKIQLQNERQVALKRMESSMSPTKINAEHFYARIIKKLWILLEMQDIATVISEHESKVIPLLVSVSLSDVKAFQGFISEGHGHDMLDEFFQSKWQNEVRDETDETTFQDVLYSFKEQMSGTQIWINALFSLLVLLVLWCVTVFIRDTLNAFKWSRVIVIMCIILFAISCLYQYNLMIKIAMAKRHSDIMTQGNEEVSKNCVNKAPSIWERIKLSIVGGESLCERYFQQTLVTPTDEVTPIMVISETITAFFFQPLQTCGKHIGLFFNNFYGTVPLLYQIPATIVFLIVFMFFLFASFGYGIEFPFWMGGIKPFYPKNTTDEAQLNRMIEENNRQMREERESILREAKQMLEGISQAAISHAQNLQHQPLAQPIFLNAASIIERQLEQLIAKQFSALEFPSSNSHNSRRGSASRIGGLNESQFPICLSPVESSRDKIDGGRFSSTPNQPDAVHRRLCIKAEESVIQDPLAQSGRDTSCVASAADKSSNDEEFVAQVRSILEESISSEVNLTSPIQTPSERRASGGDGFLQKVKNIMTP